MRKLKEEVEQWLVDINHGTRCVNNKPVGTLVAGTTC